MRHMVQMRPQGDPGAKQYSPQRDLANIFLPMLEEVFAGLSHGNMNEFFKEWFERDGLNDDAIGEVANQLVEAVQLYTRDAEVKSPADAFQKAGLFDLPAVVRYAIFARLGEVLMGGFFVAIRDVTNRNEESTCQDEMARMIAAGRELSSRLSGHLEKYPVSELGILQATIEEQRRVIRQASANVDTLMLEQDALTRKVAETTKQLDDSSAVVRCVEHARSGGLLQRLKGAAKAALLVIRG